MSNKLEKDYGIEILRLVLMVFIVCHHIIVHGFGFSSLKYNTWNGDSTYLLTLLNSFFVVPVNIFFIISGYFGIRRNWHKIIEIHLEEIFYAVCSMILVIVICGGTLFDIIMPLLIPEYYYWFILIYLILILISVLP